MSRAAYKTIGSQRAIAKSSQRHIWFGGDQERIKALLLLKVLVDGVSGCWLFQGSVTNNGYGKLQVPVADSGRWKTRNAHKVFFEEFTGSRVPDGMHLDHLCRVPHCVNPHHLEVVTPAENLRRGVGAIMTAISNKMRGAATTHCVRGHKYTSENTVRSSEGRRRCKTCWKAGFKKYNDAKALRSRIEATRRSGSVRSR